MFNANGFNVLAVHIESKMILFTRELLQGVSDYSSGKFCIDYAFGWKMAVLL